MCPQILDVPKEPCPLKCNLMHNPRKCDLCHHIYLVSTNTCHLSYIIVKQAVGLRPSFLLFPKESLHICLLGLLYLSVPRISEYMITCKQTYEWCPILLTTSRKSCSTAVNQVNPYYIVLSELHWGYEIGILFSLSLFSFPQVLQADWPFLLCPISNQIGFPNHTTTPCHIHQDSFLSLPTSCLLSTHLFLMLSWSANNTTFGLLSIHIFLMQSWSAPSYVPRLVDSDFYLIYLHHGRFLNPYIKQPPLTCNLVTHKSQNFSVLRFLSMRIKVN